MHLLCPCTGWHLLFISLETGIVFTHRYTHTHTHTHTHTCSHIHTCSHTHTASHHKRTHTSRTHNKPTHHTKTRPPPPHPPAHTFHKVTRVLKPDHMQTLSGV